MSAGDTPHPDRQQWQAFSQGRVAPAERVALQNHLDTCSSCCESLVLLADDDPFVARLRRVQHRAQDTPAVSQAASSDTDLRRPRRSAQEGSAVPEVPGYEVLTELGRGGMGVVYKARQLGLNRLVALKVLLAGAHASPDDLARFRGEAELVAQLRHENVVQIHEIGAHNGLPYFALELCDGGSLAEYAHGEPQPPRDAALLVEALARGVQAAHQLGIVHRDLKPANVLLAACGLAGDAAKPQAAVPKITDFGLARWLEQEGLTGTNAVVGTPSYMAPEQAAGQGKSLGVTADVYALGAILYELLTGRPPFRGPTPLDTLQLVKTAEPVAPSRLQPGVPRDLETICLKCLQKEPGRRYASARDLAEDLRAFQAHEPIRARPAGIVERGWRWARRRPAIASLLALVVLLLVTGFGLVTWQLLEKEAAREQAEERQKDAESERGKAVKARNDAVQARNDAQELTAGMRLDKGIDLAERGEVSAGLFWMLEAARTAPEGATDLRRAALLNLAGWLGYAPGLRHRVVLAPYTHCLDFRPDGKLLGYFCVGDMPHRQAEVYRQDTTDVFQQLRWKPPIDARFMVLSPNGQFVLLVCPQGNDGALTQCWELDTGKRLGEPVPGPVCSPVFRPGSTVFAVAEAGCVRLRDAALGKIVQELPLEGNPGVACLAFSPDGKKLVVATGKAHQLQPATARIWDLDRGQPIGEPLTHRGSINSAAFSRDGNHVLTGSTDCTAQRWDAGTGKPVGAPLAHAHGVDLVGFTPDGATLTLDQFSALACWDAHTGERLVSRLPPTSTVLPWFSANGKQVVVAPSHGLVPTTDKQLSTVEYWQVGRGAAGLVLARMGQQRQMSQGPGPSRELIRFSPDGRVALLCSAAGQGRLIDTASGQQRGQLISPTWKILNAEFSPNNQRIAVVRSGDKPYTTLCEMLDTATGLPVYPSFQVAAGSALVFSPNGKLLVSASKPSAAVWDAEKGKLPGAASR